MEGKDREVTRQRERERVNVRGRFCAGERGERTTLNERFKEEREREQ
jgi:hypothetical protein